MTTEFVKVRSIRGKSLSTALQPLPIRPKSQSLIEIDPDACERVAGLLGAHTIPLDREDVGVSNLTSDQLGNFYFLAVAICHQTSPWNRPGLSGEVNGKHSRGWDYLIARLRASVELHPDLLTPNRWLTITSADIAAIFYDADTMNTISDPDGRASLIRDLGREMGASGWISLDNIYASCKGRIQAGLPNLLSELAKFRAYGDPVRKKAFFLLSIMRSLGVWRYVDEEHLGPPVDYHEVRGHLRLGTVRVIDPSLKKKLLTQERVTADEDIAIRQTVFDAILTISHLLRLHNPSQLHYLFWNVFRSCCGRDSTHCEGCHASCSLPDRYRHLTTKNGMQRCPFTEICPSRRLDNRYAEHVIETDYY